MHKLREARGQGARCGHVDGRARASSYVLGEENILADEAEANGNVEYLAPEERAAWRRGYCYGYRLGAEGEEIAGPLGLSPRT